MSPEDEELWGHLKRVTKHAFVGVGLFIVLAIPAIALDFFNQGVEIVAIQANAGGQSQEKTAQEKAAEEKAAQDPTGSHERGLKQVKVSEPVKYSLHAAELFVLLCDVIVFVFVLANGAWIFVRSLKWK